MCLFLVFDRTVIEFTCITSAYGAKAQHMHTDVVPQGSAQRFARSFVPSYSLFIPLQNTTSEMGATYICPGTHMCYSGGEEFCDETAVQASGPDNNWPVGWGALVNQQTLHKGAAHIDKHGLERALFIVTFAPRPRWDRHQVETRILGTGGSYSLHWSQWGHTVSDFTDPAQRMNTPWRHLRSLGLFKPRTRKWGWDFWTVTHQRVAQGELGYPSDSFFEALREGELDWIPEKIRGHRTVYGSPSDYEQEDAKSAWAVFAETVIQNTTTIVEKTYFTVFCAFWGVLTLANIVFYFVGARTAFYKSIRRMVIGHVVIAFCASLCLRNLERGSWARNLQRGLSFNVQLTGISHLPSLPSTLATEQDVLETNDYQSPYLGSFSEILDYSHSGNILWRNEVEASYMNYDGMSFSVRNLLCRELITRVGQNGGRILGKNQFNEWSAMTLPMAMDFCDTALRSKSNQYVGNLMKWTDYLLSELRFGYWRNARSLNSLTVKQLLTVQSKLLKQSGTGQQTNSLFVSGPMEPKRFSYSYVNRLPSLRPGRPGRNMFPPRPEAEEPYLGAWLEVGDLVEGKYKGTFDGKSNIL